MKKTLFCVAMLPLILTACASGPDTSPASARRTSDADFTTGSNIPRRSRMGGDGVSVVTREDLEKAQSSMGQGSTTTSGN